MTDRAVHTLRHNMTAVCTYQASWTTYVGKSINGVHKLPWKSSPTVMHE